MPRPKKGPRFGRDPAHQRLIMANLAAHLFEAGHIETTLPRAKALRPYAEHLITKAKHGGVHQRRHVIGSQLMSFISQKYDLIPSPSSNVVIAVPCSDKLRR